MKTMAVLSVLLPILGAALVVLGVVIQSNAWAGLPVSIGLQLEHLQNSNVDDAAIRLGAEVAIREINSRGGVLQGRQLKLDLRETQGSALAGRTNLRGFADNSQMVAFMVGQGKALTSEDIQRLSTLKIPLLNPGATPLPDLDQESNPKWVFSTSLREELIAPAVLRYAREKGYQRLGAILPDNAWGLSSHEAMNRALLQSATGLQVSTSWYAQGAEDVLIDSYQRLVRAGCDAIFLVASEQEGIQLLRSLKKHPEIQSLPIISHWGVTGGNLSKLEGKTHQTWDLVIVQTYSFGGARNRRGRALADAAMQYFEVNHPEKIPAPQFVVQAYDLVHMLALAIERAGSTDREAVRDALEQIPNYNGAVRRYIKPFANVNHEALTPEDVHFSRFLPSGRLEIVR